MNVTKPVLSVRAALEALLDACAAVDSANSRQIVDPHAEEDARAALAAPFGLTLEQEPKYTVNDFGRIVNRETGVPIPDDEPVMLFRAKDVHAGPTARRYVDLVSERGHKEAGFERYQRFVDFAEQHPERMREPN